MVVPDPCRRDVLVLAWEADVAGPEVLRYQVSATLYGSGAAHDRPPSNLDLADLADNNGTPPEAKPYDEPTFATYLILRRSLGQIVAKVTDHFQMLRETVQYRDVEEIDAEFKVFMRDLPRAFRMNDPDKTWDASESERRWAGVRAYARIVVPAGASILHPDGDSALHHHSPREPDETGTGYRS